MKRADRRAFALAYGAWLFGIFAFFIPGATWNPVSRFNLTRAVVERGSLNVDPYWTSTGDRARVGGHWYSDKPPVVAIAAVPAYAVVRTSQRLRGVQPDYQSLTIGRTPAARVIPNRAFTQGLYVCSLATSGVAGVALALLLFRFLLRRVRTSAAFLGSCLAVLGTSILPYATSFYGHVTAAALVLGAIYSLDPLGSRPRGGPPSQRRVRVAGACISLAAGAEYLTAVPGALVLLSYLAWTDPKARAKAFLNLVIGGLFPALLVAAYHTAVFGAPWRTGYSFEDQALFATGHSSGFMGIRAPTLGGIYGLTFSVRRGLFYISPMAAVATFFAVRHAVRRRDWAVTTGLGVLVTLLLLNAGYYMWWGGASAGPRHLVPGMAFLGMGAALMLRVRHPWVKAIVVGLCVVSLANCFALTLVGLEAPETGDILRQFVWPRFRVANLAHAGGATNLGMRLGLSGPASVVALVIWTSAGFIYLYRKATQARPRASDA